MKPNIKKLATGQRFLVVAALLLGGFAFSSQLSYADPLEKTESFVLISEADLEVWENEERDPALEGLDPDQFIGSKFTPVENAPKIFILEPGASGEERIELLAPIDFIMKFEPQGEAVIDLESIEVEVYKFFKWRNVTERILEHAEVSQEGLQALQAEIPKGKHKMRLKVKDSLGREARAQIVFRIAKKSS